jgi:hypothetical protein
MNELLQLIAAWRPELVLPGEGEEAMAKLAAAAPQPLPPDYAELLAAAGGAAALILGPRYDPSAAAVTRFHRRGGWKAPADHLVIAVDESGEGMDIYLQLSTAAVVEIERWSEPARAALLYQSLAQMFFSRAFHALRMPQFPRRALFGQTQPQPPLQPLHELAEELALRPVPHTGGFAPCYDGGDCALQAYLPPGRGLYLAAAALDDARLIPLQRVLERLMPVRRVQ